MNVFDLIEFGIDSGIPHGITVQFHTNDFFCPSGSHHTDGTDTTVGINHPLFSSQSCIVHGGLIQALRLHRIHLIEGLG